MASTKKVVQVQEQEQEQVQEQEQEQVKSNPIKTSKVETVLMPSPKSGTFGVKIKELVSLKDTSIPDAKEAMRPLTQSQVDSLVEGEHDKIPPIGVQFSNQGYIVVDGYHRWEAEKRRATQAWKEKHNISDEDDISIHSKALDDFIGNTIIKVECTHYGTFERLIAAHIEANTTHGLPASQKTRCWYALWLYNQYRTSEVPLSLRECAKRANVTHVAVIHYRDLRKRQIDKAEGAELTEEQEKQEEIEAIARGEKQAKSFCTALVKTAKLLENDSVSDSVLFLAQYFDASSVDALSQMVDILDKTLTLVDERIEAEEAKKESTTKTKARRGV